MEKARGLRRAGSTPWPTRARHTARARPRERIRASPAGAPGCAWPSTSTSSERCRWRRAPSRASPPKHSGTSSVDANPKSIEQFSPLRHSARFSCESDSGWVGGMVGNNSVGELLVVFASFTPPAARLFSSLPFPSPFLITYLCECGHADEPARADQPFEELRVAGKCPAGRPVHAAELSDRCGGQE